MVNIAVFVSGRGTNLQAIIDAVENKTLSNCKISLVISNNSKAYALERAKKHQIETFVIEKELSRDRIPKVMLQQLEKGKIDLIVLAGYMQIIPKEVVDEYKGKIINIHPSLIPKYCGIGFFGERVHQAVIDQGESESGATSHYVDEGVDTGDIIIQKRVPVLKGDTAATLGERILKVEHDILIESINIVIGE